MEAWESDHSAQNECGLDAAKTDFRPYVDIPVVRQSTAVLCDIHGAERCGNSVAVHPA